MKTFLVLCLISGLTGKLRECYSLTMQSRNICVEEREAIQQQNKTMAAFCLDEVSLSELKEASNKIGIKR